MREYQALLPSPIGNLVIAGTESAVTSILFSDQENLHDIATSEMISLPQVLHCCITRLQEYFEGTRQNFDIPLAQKGTAFQQLVWENLLTIPYAKTCSYLELARKIGNAKSIRAVGTTNGKNQLSIVVPCHRVIGSDGSLTGYGGGLWRKKWLLEHERKIAYGIQTLF